ncbi:hypothetical protein [Alistipes sp.]|uniref:hypothetical protein n=1 Tax=Alistipes sp. TaxID=1872444 RepID=UPI0011DE12A9|nr:hypothetical protein [Alistipes sp.]
MLLKIIITAGFALLLLRLLLKRVDWASIEEHNRRYYNDDGDHLYYDRKLIRHKKRQAEKRQER